MSKHAYYAVFVPEESGNVAVWFPDVPGCQTWGTSMEHAFDMAMEALEGHLESMVADGDPIPAPSHYKEVWSKVLKEFEEEGETMPEGTALQLVPVSDVQEPPARVNVSFRKSTLLMIDRKADEAGMTRSGFLTRAAEAYEVDRHI